jgi:hypothetical protein
MPSINLTPVQSALLDLAAAEAGRQTESAKRVYTQATNRMRDAVGRVLAEHNTKAPDEANIRIVAGADGNAASVTWELPTPSAETNVTKPGRQDSSPATATHTSNLNQIRAEGSEAEIITFPKVPAGAGI